MTTPTSEQSFWEQLWLKTLREHPDRSRIRSPNAHLVATAALDPRASEVVADERPRAAAGSGVDALIRVRRVA